jgi:DNA-directed RNA polymerases I and III subunit RPAC1
MLILSQDLKVQIHCNNPNDLQFSLIGVDASIANAFRRILMAEIPTLAFEDVYVMNNTSIVQDEVLAHRLGLIPLKANKELLQWMTWVRREDKATEYVPTDRNTLVLDLNVECTWKEGGREKFIKGVTDPEELYENHNGKSLHPPSESATY